MNLTEANHILRLTDAQLALVRRAAPTLRLVTRDRFMRIVASELAEAERVDGGTVQWTVEAVLASLVET